MLHLDNIPYLTYQVHELDLREIQMHSFKRYMAANKQTSVHTYMHNALPLVWGLGEITLAGLKQSVGTKYCYEFLVKTQQTCT